MIRLQNNSKKRVSHCIEKDYLYKPYDYIYWAVSENGAFCYGDIANCGNQSIEFLSNNGGLRQSIFSRACSHKKSIKNHSQHDDR